MLQSDADEGAGHQVHAVLITIIIEQFVMQTSLPVTGRVRRAAVVAPDRVSIWPAMLQAAVWPPKIAFSDDDLRVLTTEDWPE